MGITATGGQGPEDVNCGTDERPDEPDQWPDYSMEEAEEETKGNLVGQNFNMTARWALSSKMSVSVIVTAISLILSITAT